MANEKPEGMTEAHFKYLDDLRASGRMNMFGAAAYLADDMNISESAAGKYLKHWMETFNERFSEGSTQ